MLKNGSMRRIILATIALIVTGIIYVFPESDHEIPKVITYQSDSLSPIYLVDENNYVARTEILIEGEDDLVRVKKIIEALTIDSDTNDYLPEGFKPIIPSGTQILEYSIEDNLLKIDFSKEFLNTSLEDENKLLESIIYSITENTSVDNIMIFVEGTHLLRMPISNKRIPALLSRDFGINKIFDLSNYNNISSTTVYYIGGDSSNNYYIPITYVNNDLTNKVEIIIEQLKSSPIYQSNVMSYLASNVMLLDYEVKQNIATLNFNEQLFNDVDNKILEEVTYTIYLSLKDNLDVSEVNFEVNNEFVTSLELK